MKSLSKSAYSQLPETAEMQFAKNVAALQSEVKSGCLYGKCFQLIRGRKQLLPLEVAEMKHLRQILKQQNEHF